jgi:hypothetical protein
MRDLPAARWASDPYGRHELRYWDGAAWTAHVSDGGVTSHDLVPGVAAGQAAAHADDPTQAMPVVVGAPLMTDEAPGPDDATVAMPAVPAPAVESPGPMDVTAGAAGLGGLFGGPPVPAPAPARPPAVPRRGLVAAVSGLAVVGLVAGVVGFSGLPGGGDDGGSDGVVPVAAAPTTSAPTDDVAPETATEDPFVSETSYGGPTTSPVERTTTTVKTSTSTSTSRTTTTTTTPAATTRTTPRTTPPTRPTTLPTELTRYTSCRAMNRDYPHGVGRPGARDRNQGSGGDRVENFYVSAPLYFVNAMLDVDGDGIDCEA